MVREMRDAGLSMRAIADKMDMPTSTVHAILTHRMRAILPVEWRRSRE